ncbi:unnamed protein product [Rotaria magnacalcarata]|uniref:DUF962 domain-containing protein n=1 Tax=Rotaria magnacalcarata TaxID=392030 RepID=A0A816WQ76_9BILA|nr:unnamed protein product [Rotaria magnacalcarata]CAF1589319.1 unnamed protein product [Rotaria magnacalcarata]CAF2070051.1 unnamed protein product [Rotaria magnacalcarata]CAF2129452.1 unnamed protein product [Rotaria magnacalcarata]CAF2137060.1 unnamed protein product [Rotaria magnacalcarata]
MTRIGLPLLYPFFKGESLENEFGFVNYYHNNPINRFLHTLTLPLLIFSLLTITHSIDYRLCMLFYLVYCAIIFIFDIKTGLAFFSLFALLYVPATVFSSQGILASFYGSLIFFTALIIQGVGHYIFQQGAPAFRLFEATFTTPAYLMMYLITNHNDIFWNNVKNETSKWKQILKK